LIHSLNNLKQKNQLSEDKKNMLLKLLSSKTHLREKLLAMQHEMDELAKKLTLNKGSVSASQSIRPGVNITIGDARYPVENELKNCTLRNTGSKVTIVGPSV